MPLGRVPVVRSYHVDLFTRHPYGGNSLAVLLSRLGAQSAYLLDAVSMEGRHCNNDGLVEAGGNVVFAGTGHPDRPE